MRRKALFVLAAAVAVIPFAPALADWAPTRWGMTVAQVMATVPGATAMPQKDTQNLRGLHMLVEAPGMVGNFQVNARYYFKPGPGPLDLVNLTLNDRARCAEFRDSLTARYGAGSRTDETGNYEGTPYETTTIEWTGSRPDRLTYSDMHFGERFGLCKLIVQKR